jgi:hypothetical protein
MGLPIETISYPNNGLFSVVNRVLGRCLHNATVGKLTRVDWYHSLYANPEVNAWDIILKQPYTLAQSEVSLSKASDGVPPERIIGPRVICSDWGLKFCDSLMLPPILPDANICLNFFEPLPEIYSKVDFLVSNLQIEDCVGVHMRGPGRDQGAVRHMNRHFNLVSGMPFNEFTKVIDTISDSNRLFVCSDAAEAIALFKEKYGERVVTTGSLLLHGGEAHEKGEYKRVGDCLIKDALIDALLLSKCKHLIHGNSNVTNFIQAYCPTQSHCDIYQKFYRVGLPYITK